MMKVDEFLSGKVSPKPNVPNLNGRVGWDSNMLLLPRDRDIGMHCQPAQQQSMQPHMAHDTVYLCPLCSYPEPSKDSAFQLLDLDKCHKCKYCKKASKLQDWQCMCQTPWHRCTRHCAHLQATTVDDRGCNASKARPQAKRDLGPLSAADLCAIDAKRRRKMPARLLAPTANMLSNKLRQKFAYLFEH